MTAALTAPGRSRLIRWLFLLLGLAAASLLVWHGQFWIRKWWARERIEALEAKVPSAHELADHEDAELRDALAELCASHPEEFSRTILDSTKPEVVRWYAIFAVRQSAQVECFEAIRRVINGDETHGLRIQAMMVLLTIANRLAPSDLLGCEDGLIAILRAGTRPNDDERAMSLLALARSRKALPLLIELLSDTKVHSHTITEDGREIPNTLSASAHKALQKITGKDLPPTREAWEAWLSP